MNTCRVRLKNVKLFELASQTSEFSQNQISILVIPFKDFCPSERGKMKTCIQALIKI